MTSVVDASQPRAPVQNTDQVAADTKDHLHSILHTINDSDPKSAGVRTSPPKSETLCSTGTFAKFPNFPGRPQTPRNGLRRPGGQGVVGSNPASPTKRKPRLYAGVFVLSGLCHVGIRRQIAEGDQRLPPARQISNLGFTPGFLLLLGLCSHSSRAQHQLLPVALDRCAFRQPSIRGHQPLWSRAVHPSGE